jgi:hypothetical protein
MESALTAQLDILLQVDSALLELPIANPSTQILPFACNVFRVTI